MKPKLAVALALAVIALPIAMPAILWRETFGTGESGGPSRGVKLLRRLRRQSTRTIAADNRRGWEWEPTSPAHQVSRKTR